MSFLYGHDVHLSGNGRDILPGNFANDMNSTIFKRILTQETWIDKRLFIENNKRM